MTEKNNWMYALKNVDTKRKLLKVDNILASFLDPIANELASSLSSFLLTIACPEVRFACTFCFAIFDSNLRREVQ